MRDPTRDPAHALRTTRRVPEDRARSTPAPGDTPRTEDRRPSPALHDASGDRAPRIPARSKAAPVMSVTVQRAVPDPAVTAEEENALAA